MQISIVDLVNPIVYIVYDLIQTALGLWDTFMGLLLPFLQMIPIPIPVPWSPVVATLMFMFVLGLVLSLAKRSGGGEEEEMHLPIPSRGGTASGATGDLVTSFIVSKKRDFDPESVRKIIEQETSSALSAISVAKKENRISDPLATELERRFLLRLKNLKQDLEITVPSHEEDRLLDELAKLKEQAREREEEVKTLQDRVKEVKPSDSVDQPDMVVPPPTADIPPVPTPAAPSPQEPEPVSPPPAAPAEPPKGDASGEALISEMLSAIQTITKEFKSEQS
ncbi:MAG: hypothetical protein ACW976_03135 [Candidatus Ranarchaeia archaeon]|jgi:hypothetical protein